MPAHAATSGTATDGGVGAPTPLTIQLDCEAATSSGVPDPYLAFTLFTISGSVTAIPFVSDLNLSGIVVDVELGPGDTFASDTANTGPGNIVQVTTMADGSFSIEKPHQLVGQQADVCRELGFQMSLASAVSLEANNPGFAVTLDTTQCGAESSCSRPF